MNQDQEDFKDIKDDILIVKARFKAASLNLYGQLILIFKNNQNFESYNSVVSTYSDLYNLEPHEDWLKYREFIANVKWKGNFNTNMTSSIMDQFKKFSEEMNSISIFYKHICDYDYNAMDITLFDLVNRIIHDKNLVLESAIQELTPSEFSSATARTDTKEKPIETIQGPNEGYPVEDDAVILPVKPIVAPVRGKPIYEIRVGDKVMIYILPQSDRANYFIDHLRLREENEIKPAPAEVIDIKGGSGKNNPTDILALIAPGIYGKFTETEKQVKLRMYNYDLDGPVEKGRASADGGKGKSGKGSGAPGMSKASIVMLVLFMIILALFVVLIFLII
jgi:hypothetical protein